MTASEKRKSERIRWEHVLAVAAKLYIKPNVVQAKITLQLYQIVMARQSSTFYNNTRLFTIEKTTTQERAYDP